MILQDNSCWSLDIDSEIMNWASQNPEDWQIGGKCEAYMWGYERHGQLCEGGRVVLTPKNVMSYSIAQQVNSKLDVFKRQNILERLSIL